MDEIVKRLESIERLMLSQNLSQKAVLSLADPCLYVELSESHLYKLAITGVISHYKPNGKIIYFKRTELDEWLLRNKAESADELAAQAANFLAKLGRVAS